MLRSLIMRSVPINGGYTPGTELVAALNADAVLDSTIRPNNVPVHKLSQLVSS